MSIRAEKVSSLIKRILVEPIAAIANEVQAGLVTVTAVRISKDLQIANVYISVYGGKITPLSFIDILSKRKGEIRSQLGSQIRLRYTPDLRFFLDDTLDQMENIQQLLDSVKKSSD